MPLIWLRAGVDGRSHPAAADRLLGWWRASCCRSPRRHCAIGARLEALRERTPRGGQPGSVAHVIARARQAGLLPPTV